MFGDFTIFGHANSCNPQNTASRCQNRNLIPLCSMNLTMMLYGMVNLLIQKLGFESFDFMAHTVTGKISMIPMEMSGADVRSALIIAAAFTVCALALAGTVFQKRDV